MKNYRFLIPVILVALMGVSIYSMITGAISKQNKVENLLSQANKAVEQGLYDKAASYYTEVINLDNNIRYYVEIADMYYDADQYDVSKKWCEQLLAAFPGSSESYERMIRVCLQLESYSDAYETLNEFDGRNLSSDMIEEYRNRMKYLYYTNSVAYDSITRESSGYVGIQNNELWGLATVTGANKVKPQFEKIGYYANNMVAVLDSGNWYFINAEGEYIFNVSGSVEGSVLDVGMYNNELIPINIDGVYSYYNLEFEKQFGEYDYAGTFNGGVAAVKTGEKWKIIDSSGNPVSENEYYDVILDERGICCQKERLFVKITEDEYIMIDNSGNQVGGEIFDGAKLFAGDDYAAISKDDLWGFISLSGEIVIEPEYDEAKSYSIGIAPVCKNGLWGYVDIDGNQIIELKYTDCLNFSSSGTAFVQMGDSWEIIKLYEYNY